MPKEVAVALIALGGVVLGAAIGGGFGMASLLVNRRFAVKDRDADHREWYRRSLFEKRLDAAQEGYHWLMRLNRATSQPEARTPGSEQNRAVAALSQEAREWYDANCVFLEDSAPSSSFYIGALNAAGTDLFWKMCIDAEKELRERLNKLFEGERTLKGRSKAEDDG